MLYPLDENGYVINESARDKVQYEYAPAVNGITALLQELFGPSLASVHIRGSVSVGRAIPSISDIDVVALVSETPSNEIRERLQTSIDMLRTTYPFIPFMDVTVLTKQMLTTNPEYKNLCIYLATQSFCVWGADMHDFLPKVLPGRELALHMYGDIENELESLRRTIAGTELRTYLGREQPITFWCVWLMRVLLRTGLGIVMFRKPVFSQDLVTCGEELVTLYPGLGPYVQKALTYAVQPTDSREDLLKFYDEYVPKFIQIWNENTYATK